MNCRLAVDPVLALLELVRLGLLLLVPLLLDPLLLVPAELVQVPDAVDVVDLAALAEEEARAICKA